MSHIVEIQTEVRDLAAAQAACQRLRLEPPIEGRARLFSGEAAGLIVGRSHSLFLLGGVSDDTKRVEPRCGPLHG